MTLPRKITQAFLVVLIFVVTGCASNVPLDMDRIQAAEIFNLRAPEPIVLSSGQPTQEQLGVIASSGVRHVINLRTPQEEIDFTESAVVESLGMTYYSIPVAGGGGINAENAQTLQQILAQLDGEPVLIHCASGNRVGGLMAVSAFAGGASLESAMAEGQRWGMTSERTQEAVRGNLSGN